jgi:hypothetical protein
MRAKKTITILGVLMAMLLIATVVPALAGGKGGEPGANCPMADTINFRYVPPPYMGTITGVRDESGNVSIFGKVEQVGKSDCFCEITASEPYFYGKIEIPFEELQANDIRGACLIELDALGCTCIIEPAYVEIVGAGNLKFSADKSQFTVETVLMELQTNVVSFK